MTNLADCTEILARTRSLVPLIRSNAKRTETEREIPEEVIDGLQEAGLFRLYQPKRFGGYELPYGLLQLRISSLIGAACGSTAWVQSGIATHTWLLACFPMAAQEAAWSVRDGRALVATAVSHSKYAVEKRPGGIVLSGRWHFSSGCRACDWIIVRVPVPIGEDKAETRLCLVEKRKVEVVDVWNPVGLKGTGSNDIVIDQVFIPDEHMIDFQTLRGSEGDSRSPHPSYLYRVPYTGLFAFTIAAPAIGVALGALADFQEETSGRADRRVQVPRQIKFAESAAEADCADLLLQQNSKWMEALVAEEKFSDTPGRTEARRNTAYASRLCRQSTARLVEGLGAHGVFNDHPVQRAYRDLLAITSHIGLNWDSGGEAYGRTRFGLPSADPML